MKIFTWSIVSVLILLLVIIIGTKLYFNDERIREIIVNSAKENLGREISIEKASISFWGGLGAKLYNVNVSNPQNLSQESQLLQAKKIELKLGLLPLFFSEYRIDKLLIVKPVINLYKSKNGLSNYSFNLSDSVNNSVPDETKLVTGLVTFNQLEIKEGTITFIDDSTNSNLDLINFNLTSFLNRPYENHYRSEGSIDVSEFLLNFGIKVNTSKTRIFWSADYDSDKKFLTLRNSGIKLGDLEFDLSGEFSHRNEKSGRFVVQSDRVEARKLFSLISADEKDLLEGFNIDGRFSFNAELIYDNSRDPVFVYTGNAVISDMTMTYSDVDGELRFKNAMLDIKPDNLRFNIQNGSFDNKPLSGQFVLDNFENPYLNGDVKGEIDLVFLKPFLPTENKHELSGQTSFNLKISGLIDDIQNLDVTGEIKINNGSYSSVLIPEPVDSFMLNAFFDNRLLRVNKFQSFSAKSNIAFNGRLTNVIPFLFADSIEFENIESILDGKLKAKTKLSLLQPYLPQENKPELNGDLDIDLTLSGNIVHPSTIDIWGLVLVKQGLYNDSLLPEPINDFNGRFRVFPDSIRVEEFNAVFTSSDFSLNGTLIKPLPYLLPIENLNRKKITKPVFNFILNSKVFSVDKLFPEVVPGSQVTSDSIYTKVAVDSISPVILPDIIARGEFEIDSLIYNKIDFTDISGWLIYQDRIIECSDVTGKVYTGNISGETKVDLTDFENPVYTGNFNATQIEANDFMSRFTKLSGYVYGKFNFTGSYQAIGWEPEEFFNSLKMNTDATMKEGKIVTSGAVYQSIKSLAENLGNGFEKEQYLKNASSKITVADGKVMLDTMTTKLGKLGDLLLNGYYSFDNDLAYNGMLILSKNASAKLRSNKGLLGAISGILTDRKNDRISLPLTVTGTFDNPDLKIDYSSLTDDAKEKLFEGAENKLKDLLEK